MFTALLLLLATLMLAHAAPIRRQAPPPPTSNNSTSGNPKLVVAHVIVGNTYAFTPAAWAADMQLAQGAGIDGFALNVGSDSWQPGHVADAYVALYLFWRARC
jgi:glucan endo-1,3-alpha-glucosidase